jgi:hypothetical protein
MTAKKSATREAARRSRGRPVSTVLTSPEAIASLETLIAKLGGPKAAIGAALAAYPKEEATTGGVDCGLGPQGEAAG